MNKDGSPLALWLLWSRDAGLAMWGQRQTDPGQPDVAGVPGGGPRGEGGDPLPPRGLQDGGQRPDASCPTAGPPRTQVCPAVCCH